MDSPRKFSARDMGYALFIGAAAILLIWSLIESYGSRARLQSIEDDYELTQAYVNDLRLIMVEAGLEVPEQEERR